MLIDDLISTANDPPPPYQILFPGIPIKQGDILMTTVEGSGVKWRLLGPEHFGHPVPDRIAVMARACAPDSYETEADPEAVIQLGWLYVNTASENSEWAVVDQGAGATVGQTTAFVAARNPDALIAFARPVTLPEAVAPVIPTRHRALFPGETLRRGDKWFSATTGAWRPVFPLGAAKPDDAKHTCGHMVPDTIDDPPPEAYCRPISSEAQNWFVDLREGGEGDDARGDGTRETPFGTLSGACARIEKTYESAKRCPHGIVWDVRGVPLFAYDLPEPMEQPQVATEPVITATAARQAKKARSRTLETRVIRVKSLITQLEKALTALKAELVALMAVEEEVCSG